MDHKVCIFEHGELSLERFSRIIDELGLHRIKKAGKIVVKPNLCAGDRFGMESGVVTSLKLVDDLISFINVMNKDCSILIVESDSTGHCYAYKKYGNNNYHLLEKKYKNVRLVDLTRDRHEIIDLNGIFFSKFDMPSSIKGCDFLINLAKMKTNTNTTITGCLKNSFGLIPAGDKKAFHPFLSEVIVDVNRLIRSDLCIVESNPAMEGPGPVHGMKKDVKTMIMGNNALATDLITASVMGFDHRKIHHLRYAAKHGLGPGSLSDIAVSGKMVRHSFSFIPFWHRINIRLGFFCQRLSSVFGRTGHIIHNQPSISNVFRIPLDAILLRLRRGGR